MSTICCKGCYTEPCSRCEYYICPTSGHRQGDSAYGSWLCNSCIRTVESYANEVKLGIYQRAQKEKRILTEEEETIIRNIRNLSYSEIEALHTKKQAAAQRCMYHDDADDDAADNDD